MRRPRERSCTLSLNLGQTGSLQTVVSAESNVINIYVFLMMILTVCERKHERLIHKTFMFIKYNVLMKFVRHAVFNINKVKRTFEP